MKTGSPRRYRASEKRDATREQNRAAIEAAAWEVFCELGVEAASVRDIVTRSGVSPGTFYNYYGTKEAIFTVLAGKVLDRIRSETRAARARAATLEEFLSICYESYLSLLESIDGAFAFIERNQSRLRAEVSRSSAVSGLAADLADDLGRFVDRAAMPRRDRMLAASIIVAAGAEAVFEAGRNRRTTAYMRRFLARFMLRGLAGWAPSLTPPSTF